MQESSSRCGGVLSPTAAHLPSPLAAEGPSRVEAEPPSSSAAAAAGRQLAEQTSPSVADDMAAAVDRHFSLLFNSAAAQTRKKNHALLTVQGRVYNFLERPTGWKCFLYHFAV